MALRFFAIVIVLGQFCVIFSVITIVFRWNFWFMDLCGLMQINSFINKFCWELCEFCLCNVCLNSIKYQFSEGNVSKVCSTNDQQGWTVLSQLTWKNYKAVANAVANSSWKSILVQIRRNGPQFCISECYIRSNLSIWFWFCRLVLSLSLSLSLSLCFSLSFYCLN